MNKLMGTNLNKSNGDEDMKYRAEDALRTLERAEEHRADPKLMAAVESHRQDKMNKLAKIKIKVETGTKTIKGMK